MFGTCTSLCKHTTQNEHFELHGVSKRGKHKEVCLHTLLMIYDRHLGLQNKWNKAFWARGYYVATIGNITEEAIKEYIQEQSEDSR